MKSDMSRVTFDPTRHYKRVPLQQGRVQTDADANEQQAITVHRVETEAADLIGGCGGPLYHAGFEITPDGDDLRIGAGRYYVHGVLCENEAEVGYGEQPDYPLDAAWLAGLADPPLTLPPADGAYLAYLDVWERHLTALEAPHIREVALGGPDTATRVKTLWQVKLHALEGGDPDPEALTCLSDVPSWTEATAPSTGELGARAEVSAPSDDPCILQPGAGYRRLENQLYRVEVHQGGARNGAVYKWDRDNGTILARLEAQSATLEEWTVSSVGRDEVLRFAPGDLIELTDDSHELHGEPGTLVRVDGVEGNVITVDLSAPMPAGGSVDMADFPDNPKVRRWNGVLEGIGNQDWQDLEDGVQVRLRGGNGPDGQPRRYLTGDGWTIPARTNTGDVEWPAENDGWKPAEGIHHHYCRLAVLEYADGAGWTLTDCRDLFPPVTELTSLFYVGGDGQECMPGEELPLSLRVGVANGSHPVEGARIRFTVASGSTEIAAASGGVGEAEVEVATDANGLAECFWTPAAAPLSVEADLLDVAGDPVQLPVRFGANLSTADEVAYSPVDGCVMPESVTTVQEALDELCLRESEGGCAVTIAPGDGWQARAEAALEAADDLHLCFQAGEYATSEALLIENRGHISITGCGPATRFRNDSGETVFDVDGCASIHFADFHAEAAFAGSADDQATADHLNGVLNVTDCGNATVERVSLLTAAGGRRAVTGITVREASPGAVAGHHSTRIRSCDIGIGHHQTGILVVNTERAVVEDNHLWADARPAGYGAVEAVEFDAHLHEVLGEVMLGQPRVGLRLATRLPGTEMRRRLLRAGLTEDAVEVRRRVTLGREVTFTLSFFTPASLAQTWEAVLDEHPVASGETEQSVEQHLHTLVARTLDGRLRGPAAADLAARVDGVIRANPAVASQGIVVAKNEAPDGTPPSPDLRILNNRIEGCRQGIHLGASHGTGGEPDDPNHPCAHDALDTVLVQGNSVDVLLSPETSRERHGIFVGNARHVTVQDNRVTVRRTEAGGVWRIDGIRVWGFLGPMVLVRQNHTDGADVGVRVVPAGGDLCWPSVRHWYVSDNVALGAEPGVVAPSSVAQERNMG